MKVLKLMAVAAAVVVLAASCGSGGKVKGVEAQLPSKAETDSVSYLVGLQFGYFIKMNNFGEDLNYSQVRKGMMDFIKAEGDPQQGEAFNKQLKIDPELMNTMFNDFIAKRVAYTAEVNLKKEEAFLAANKKKDNVLETPSGLQYIILEDGNDVRPAEKDTVWVNYTGTLTDGTQFDASKGDPVRFMMNKVISGWTEGLQLIGEGGKIKLFVPSALGYGERGQGTTIGPNVTLVFDVELTKVGKVAPVVEEAPAEK